jgi:hypothetical protein
MARHQVNGLNWHRATLGRMTTYSELAKRLRKMADDLDNRGTKTVADSVVLYCLPTTITLICSDPTGENAKIEDTFT